VAVTLNSNPNWLILHAILVPDVIQVDPEFRQDHIEEHNHELHNLSQILDETVRILDHNV